MKRVFFYDSPIGKLAIAEEDGAVSRLSFRDVKSFAGFEVVETALLKKAAGQLMEYFAGRRRSFDLPLALHGTAFQMSVWRTLQTIPSGETRSYQDVAAQIGNPRACRAVGLANNRNPIAIIIPCHRVIGRDGGLTGYAGGLPAKRYLLELEKRHA